MAIFFTAVALSGGTEAGFGVNVSDLGPRFAATLFGFVNMIGSLPAFLAPLLVGALTNNHVCIQ